MLLYLGSAASCYMDLSTKFINYCDEIAKKLDLFGDPADIAHDIDPDAIRQLRGRAFTAWGIFHKMVSVSSAQSFGQH